MGSLKDELIRAGVVARRPPRDEVLAAAIEERGGQRWFFERADGCICAVHVSKGTADALRDGKLAIVQVPGDPPGTTRYRVVPRAIAEQLGDSHPDHVRFLN